jgi:hypothetical protein
MAHVILFQHANFDGSHKHIFRAEPNLGALIFPGMNDQVSSFVILEGNWQFFIDKNYVGQVGGLLGPGVYPWVGDIFIPNDKISSLRPI